MFFIYNFMNFSPYSPETRVRYWASRNECLMGTVAKGHVFPRVLRFCSVYRSAIAPTHSNTIFRGKCRQGLGKFKQSKALVNFTVLPCILIH